MLSHLKAYSVAVLMAGLIFTLSSCGDDDDTPAPPLDNIVTLAQNTNDLSSLEAALTKFPDLVSTLSGSGSFTVFAPTNAAFDALLTAIGQTSIDNVPESVLREVLEYHVVSGTAALSTSLNDGQTIATVQGENVTVGTTSGVTINGATVTSADINASNGVVHIINAVLVPATPASIVNTVVAPAYFNKDFSTLTAAVVAAGLLDDLIGDDNDWTVFAPTNAAFEAAGITTLPPNNELIPILQYHVLNTEVLEANLPETGSAVPTLNGNFYLSKNTDGVFINGTTEVVSTDIIEGNGVVHVLDNVLMPASQNVVDIAVAASQATEAEFGLLVAALTAVQNDMDAPNLITDLSNPDGAFTVFAPTDAAFQALFTLAQVQDLNGLVTAAGGIEVIATVLQYHVVSGRIFSTDIPNVLDGNMQATVTPLAGGSWTLNNNLTIADADDVLELGTTNASITGTDIFGTNGVIHTIDQVILP
ncbi:MAG: fasciclin domain-containing protein [Bacteroidota bacterium]